MVYKFTSTTSPLSMKTGSKRGLKAWCLYGLSGGSKLAGKEISIPLTSQRGLNVISDKQSHIDLLLPLRS